MIIVTHNSAELLAPVLDALYSDPDGPSEVIVVDSASEDGTIEMLRDRSLNLVQCETNIGFAAGCHMGVDVSTHEVVVFLGHDTTPEPGWLRSLVAALDDREVGVSVCTLEAADQPGSFNTSGGRLTYFGIAWMSDQGMAIPEREEGLIDIAFPQGGAMAMRKETWLQFEGFRPEFFMYNEDVDLGWRLRLAGLRVVRVPQSRVRHNFDFHRTPRKMFYMERNRWLILLSNYRRSTLSVLAPALFIVELGATVVSLRDGWWRDKFEAWRVVARSGDLIRSGRRLTQSNRLLGDADIIASMDYRLTDISQVKKPVLTAAADVVLGIWQTAAIRLIRQLDRRGRSTQRSH